MARLTEAQPMVLTITKEFAQGSPAPKVNDARRHERVDPNLAIETGQVHRHSAHTHALGRSRVGLFAFLKRQF